MCGLSPDEAARRLTTYGLNLVTRERKPNGYAGFTLLVAQNQIRLAELINFPFAAWNSSINAILAEHLQSLSTKVIALRDNPLQAITTIFDVATDKDRCRPKRPYALVDGVNASLQAGPSTKRSYLPPSRRDAVRALAEGKNAEATTLAHAMTPSPITITPDSSAIHALREMSNRGFRRLPVVEGGRI
jgi:hypothetical protein